MYALGKLTDPYSMVVEPELFIKCVRYMNTVIDHPLVIRIRYPSKLSEMYLLVSSVKRLMDICYK